MRYKSRTRFSVHSLGSALIEAGMIEPAEMSLFDFADTAEDVWDALVRRGLKGLDGR